MSRKKHQGACLCGAVSFEITGRIGHIWVCHCRECRKQTGHVVAASAVQDKDLVLSGSEHICWYESSQKARRGFCRNCGSVLFFKVKGSPNTSIMAGAFEPEPPFKIAEHWWLSEKGSYYELAEKDAALFQKNGGSYCFTVKP